MKKLAENMEKKQLLGEVCMPLSRCSTINFENLNIKLISKDNTFESYIYMKCTHKQPNIDENKPVGNWKVDTLGMKWIHYVFYVA